MLRNILIPLLLLLVIYVHAQSSFHVSSNYTTKQGRIDREVVTSVVLRNLTQRDVEMKWEVKKSNLSQGWQVVVCDHQCYTSQVNSKNFKLKPNEIIHDFKVAFRPNGKEGSGNLEILVYDVNDKDRSETIFFNATAQGSQNSMIGNISKEKIAPKIFPNPAIEYIQLKDDNNTVKLIEIYNVVGRKMQKIAVNNVGEKYDVSQLTRGMYMARMLDSKGHIVRTQRISKNNP
ncbi:MAG: T9SS type A sorting domain-containing protein [Saprospiraceae bacterium]|nr:T9SS type A sorting domain-containing protein [Saprospiraceae bacterium]